MELPGFYYFPNIIEKDVEKEIIDFLDTKEWKGITASVNSRRVQQYGYEYDYNTRSDLNYKKIEDIPDILLNIKDIAIDQINELLPKEIIEMIDFNQCIVNRYLPGQGISAHIDKETFGPAIACFTLGSGTDITFSRTLNGNKVTVDKHVESCSLYIMTDESRYNWKHEIKSRLYDNDIKRNTRISVTFRTVKG